VTLRTAPVAGATDADIASGSAHVRRTAAALLCGMLQDPRRLEALDRASWDVLIRQARRANLLARLTWQIRRWNAWDVVLPAAKPHLESAWTFSERQKLAVQWEVECIREALASTRVPLVLLKGSAYVIAGLPVAEGRLLSDIDILVPKEKIADVESALMIHGWNTIHHGGYDQHYYRKWMHEIPPMRHLKRGTIIDVHHALLPETARIKADSNNIRRSAVAVPGHEDTFVLAPIDMILHSATHLFHEGELDNGLRDLVDLDCLLQHFGERPNFWDQLVPRSREVGLARPLYYALRYAAKILQTPVPAAVLAETESYGPRQPMRRLMDFLYLRALAPNHPTSSDAWTPLARWMLYVRSHWLRMPLPLLIYHLTRKALVREKPDESRQPDRPDAADRVQR
jgi:hypothetical protein